MGRGAGVPISAPGGCTDAWRGILWPRDQACPGLGTHYVLGREVCAFVMGLPSLGTSCWYLASDMSGLETHSAAPVRRWMPTAS